MYALFKDRTQMSARYESKEKLMDAIHLYHTESYWFPNVEPVKQFREGCEIRKIEVEDGRWI